MQSTTDFLGITVTCWDTLVQPCLISMIDPDYGNQLRSAFTEIFLMCCSCQELYIDGKLGLAGSSFKTKELVGESCQANKQGNIRNSFSMDIS